jgi:hypothetical protein
MSNWQNTQEAADFIATGGSRETSKEVMEALAFFARNRDEAEKLWNGDGFGTVCTPLDLWENVTHNGLHDPEDFSWGTAGKHWWDHIQDPAPSSAP